eukprot:CAMPEP_0201594280 /NCGR_PEP_ID=MMETSP0190_2-20130828/191645_1 /ASSEMBLY_ACC=CAM_ASM_000263 /TAXON_ID=37353 /ORGANISM="Rosalina sp." /LENGTH=155 /DNA_ID=CAMNT_0048053827 /DNA_START=362 /DNA_END=829 /DNA_ORIENTATION=+
MADESVGPATASLILAVYTKIIPFMADESMLGIWPGLSLKYDMKMYLKYAEALIEKCDSLGMNEDDDLSQDDKKDGSDNDEEEEDEDGFALTPWRLGECLWIEYMMNKEDKNDTKKNKVDNKTKTKAKTKKSRKRKLSEDEDDMSSTQRVKRLRL